MPVLLPRPRGGGAASPLGVGAAASYISGRSGRGVGTRNAQCGSGLAQDSRRGCGAGGSCRGFRRSFVGVVLMDPLVLARVQFALTAGSHFVFVALTLGLATLVGVMQARATLSGRAVHARMTRFWGQLYVVNYAVGIVTGLVMEFQLGLNWSGMSRMTGGVFGAP